MSALLMETTPQADLLELIEQSPDLICTHDLAGRILSANPAAAEALGYSARQLTRMTLRDLLTEKARRLFPSYIDTLIRTGQAVGRMEVRTRNGEHRLWEYRNVLFAPSNVAVILMTGHGDVHAEAALRKPFDMDELLDRIAELEQAS